MREQENSASFETLDKDVSDLKVQVGSFRVDLSNVKAQITSIQTDTADIKAAISNIGKPNWSNWIAMASLAVILVGGMWGIAVRPLEASSVSHGADITRNAERIESSARADTRHDAMFREVEGQIKALSKLNNQRAQYQHMLLQMTWQKASGQSVTIPPLDYWPEIGEQWED